MDSQWRVGGRRVRARRGAIEGSDVTCPLAKGRGGHSSAERLSPTWLLDANGVTLRHTSAVPIWAKPGILMKVRKPHDHEREKTSHNEDEENANYVSARRVPLRPSHLFDP